MTQEIRDFEYFKEHQLLSVEFSTGCIDVRVRTKQEGIFKHVFNVGSLNQDGYARIWCNRRLRMKHRLLYWLHYGYLPEEVDHKNKVRDDNSISNLVEATRSTNTKDKTPRTYKHLSKEDVHELCKIIATGSYTITELASKFGRSRTQIKGIQSKKYWSEISDLYF